jgi:hypothetical protein
MIIKTDNGDYKFKEKISTMDRLDLIELAGQLTFAKKYVPKKDDQGKEVMDLKGIPEKELIDDQRKTMEIYAKMLDILSLDNPKPKWLIDLTEDSYAQIITHKEIQKVIAKQG